MVDQSDTPRAGVHRKKRQVDRLWFNYQLGQAGLTVTAFGTALAREMKRDEPYDKSSMTRRLQGKIPFTATECEALSRLFNTPVEEVLQRVGSSGNDTAAAVGTVNVDGHVALTLDVPPRDKFYRLGLDAQDGWESAVLTVNAACILPAHASRGVYIVHANGSKACLRQFLGVHGKQALLAAPFDASKPVEPTDSAKIHAMQRVVKITL